MNADVKWFLYLGLKNRFFEEKIAHQIVKKIGFDTDLQSLIDAIVEIPLKRSSTDLQEIVDEAWDRADEGEIPPELPFLEQEHPLQPTIKVPLIRELSVASNEEMEMAFQQLLDQCHQHGCSDLHLAAGSPIAVRKHRKFYKLGTEVLPESIARKLNFSLLRPDQIEKFKKNWDLDFAIISPLGQRYRANLSEQKEGISGTYHILDDQPCTFSELGFKDETALKALLTYQNGLILVTGPIGSGKTTTLAAMVHHLNENRRDHIITIENPIEIVQNSRDSLITQRQIEKHTQGYATAIKAALREDPDIIVFGELNDLKTIEMAITASETGHLVIGTMHTSDATSTLNRLIDVFPPIQQPQIRAMTSLSLRGIICQRLLPKKEGGLVMTPEILLNSSAVANSIREKKVYGLKSIMQTSLKKGMVLMDNSIFDCYREGVISPEVAKNNIKDKTLLQQID